VEEKEKNQSFKLGRFKINYQLFFMATQSAFVADFYARNVPLLLEN
jgi:hypothetical protein